MKMEAFLRTQTIFFTTYFVRTGNPKYLGENKILVFFYGPNTGGEGCTVLRLRLMRKLAMSHI